MRMHPFNADILHSIIAHAAELRSISLTAGKAIMQVYSRPFKMELKEDHTPVTEADKISNAIITEGLAQLPEPLGQIRILSEEGQIPSFEEQKTWCAWWLVDPLDGTKEFIQHNGEFSVNIALVVREKCEKPGIPLAGWVYSPVNDILYEGIRDKGARRYNDASKKDNNLWQALPLFSQSTSPRIVASHSYCNAETHAIIRELTQAYGNCEVKLSGSSLKLCMVAEGSAEIYPRPAPSMEWDIAAADAICRACGVQVVNTDDGSDLKYGKNDMHNPWFIVARNPDLLKIALRTLRSH